MSNLSAVLRSKNDLRVENTEMPVPKPDEVLIAMHSVGICGSDVHYWVSGQLGPYVVRDPMILGHESSGTVVEVGAKVKNLKIGDRVAIEPGVPCRYCDLCKSGRYNLCDDVQFCATPPCDGTLRHYYTHAADFCYKLPNNVTYEEGALLEPLSVAVHACRRAGVTAGDNVLVTGAGPIGLVNLLAAKAMGAQKVCITDISENRLKVAKELGATCAVNVRDKDIPTQMADIKRALGQEPSLTIECSGAESSLSLAFQVTKPGGRVALVGVGKPEAKLPILMAAIREVNIIGVFRYANCYPIALELVASGAIDLKPLVTHRFKLEDALDAFETSRTGKGDAIKVIINCETT